MKAALARAGVIALVAVPLIALGFLALTAGLWLVLEALRGAAFAWAVVGLVYLGAGLLVLGAALVSGRRQPPPPPAPESQLASVIAAMTEGFVAGMAAGRDLRRGPREG